jgi:hypothetical protein
MQVRCVYALSDPSLSGGDTILRMRGARREFTNDISADRKVARMAEPSFTKDIKPLFREKDRSSMLGRFDLWSSQDVRDNAQAILEALRGGTMPCDGPWSAEHIELFGRWIANGTLE